MTIHRTWHTLININNIKFSNSLLRSFNFLTHTILRTSKSIGNSPPMKKMLLATALALLITGCAQQTFTVQTKPRRTRKPSPIISSFLELGRRKLSMQPKFVAAQKMLLKKQKTQQTFVNGLLGFITLGIYTPLEARVYCSHNCMSCPSIWATLSALLINYTGFLPVVFA